MKISDKLKSAGFWISIISAVFLILGAFGVEIGNDLSSTIINAVSSLFLVLGIAVDPASGGSIGSIGSSTAADGEKTESDEKKE